MPLEHMLVNHLRIFYFFFKLTYALSAYISRTIVEFFFEKIKKKKNPK